MFSKRFSRQIRKKQHPDDVKGFKISTSTKQYSPFQMQDTRYLEHLREHAKLRETYEGSVLKRNELIESNKRKTYQMELDRLVNELHRPNLPYATREHMEKRIEELKKLTLLLFNIIILKIIFYYLKIIIFYYYFVSYNIIIWH